MPVSSQPLPQGTEIGGYEIARDVGEGGFGIVYEARNPTTGERVAIKEYFPKQMVRRDGNVVSVHSEQQANMYRAVLERFAYTTALQFGFDHKNILKVKNYIRGNNTGFMIAEFIDGQSLRQHLKQFGGHFPSYAAFRQLMEQIIGAVGYVHRKGHLHRDISPDNVLVDSFQKPVLIDFGSLKRNIDARTTFSSVISYRDGYSPPEQRSRNSPERFYTDIYALAGTMYFSLSGGSPMSAEERTDGIVNNRTDPYVPIGQTSKIACPAEVYRAIDRALRLPVSERHQTIEEFAAELGWQPDYGGMNQHSDVSRLTTLDTITVPEQPTEPVYEKKVVRVSPPARSSQFNQYAIVVLAVLLIAAGLGAWAMVSRNTPTVQAGILPAVTPPAVPKRVEPSPSTPTPAPNPPTPVANNPSPPTPAPAPIHAPAPTPSPREYVYVPPPPPPPPPEPPKPVLAVPDGYYDGARGYRSPPADKPNLCRSYYAISGIRVRDGLISFVSDDFEWKGSINQITGDISIPHEGIRRVDNGKLSQQGLVVSGPYRDATLRSGTCGTGFFRLQVGKW